MTRLLVEGETLVVRLLRFPLAEVRDMAAEPACWRPLRGTTDNGF